ncbi:hypothetical protein ZWY2020_031892 [Hordeum vulgare]|nr:hypothetical protein ZWY2020_031892 [Hordeum vulgare]
MENVEQSAAIDTAKIVSTTMGTSDKPSSADFHGIMANMTCCGACCSQELIEASTVKYNDSEFISHQPAPMSYYPALSIASNKIGPQFCNVSCEEHPKTDSDVTLSYIEQMLMQDIDDKVRAPHDREGGPPKLRITGIELPLPGFRPHGRKNYTQLRLVEYASMFKVPLEYRQISSKWESISIEDLNINKAPGTECSIP